MNLTGRDLERVLREAPVVQQSISHYDAPNSPVVLTMLLQDGSRVALIANQVIHELAPSAGAPVPAPKPTKAVPAPPGVTQGVSYMNQGVNNFKALGDR